MDKVNIDMAGIQKPIFCKGNNFLDWYELWLDEILVNEWVRNS
ncbi:hypothetical protein [Flagellimonas meishanensis]|nr:hypothetical protein [[Muricauda] meishanensis]